jgi:hypothetical protein
MCALLADVLRAIKKCSRDAEFLKLITFFHWMASVRAIAFAVCIRQLLLGVAAAVCITERS